MPPWLTHAFLVGGGPGGRRGSGRKGGQAGGQGQQSGARGKGGVSEHRPWAGPQRAPAPSPAMGAKGRQGRRVRAGQEAGLTTWLLRASVEEAFPTALSSIDLCLEAILKNELIVGKSWVESRRGRGRVGAGLGRAFRKEFLITS